MFTVVSRCTTKGLKLIYEVTRLTNINKNMN